MFGKKEKKIKERRYYPMVVSESGTEEKLSLAEDEKVWNAFDKLPEGKKAIMLSSEMPSKIQALQEKFRLSDVMIGQISLLIRKIFLGEVSPAQMEGYLSQSLGIQADAQSIVDFIEKEIFTIQPVAEKNEPEYRAEKTSRAIVLLPLLQALSKYSQLGNQLITKERIKIKSQVEPVRPSLIYWLKYYRDELGVGHHDSVQRGQFLFRSENGKRLSPEERERVNLILKSVEENLPLDIDTAANEIVFPRFEAPSVKPVVQPQSALSHFAFEAPVREQVSRTPERAFPTGQTVPLPAQKAPLPGKGMISFSSPHVFQAEKEEVEPKKVPTFNTNPFHIRPVSMQDDEE